MAQIGEPQRVIIAEPLWEPIPSRELQPEEPVSIPVEEPVEVPVGDELVR